ncbi:MAG: addiction module protein [bacterium]|nr:addiction module protein [bacterium]
MDKILFEKAMKMPPNERVAFAELILESIDYEEEGVRNAWISEVKDRMKAVKEGKSKLIDFEARYSEG